MTEEGRFVAAGPSEADATEAGQKKKEEPKTSTILFRNANLEKFDGRLGSVS